MLDGTPKYGVPPTDTTSKRPRCGVVVAVVVADVV
jgi:hypothetical protein